MKEYIFEHTLNPDIQVRVKANHYTEAMELLLSVTRYIEDFKLLKQP